MRLSESLHPAYHLRPNKAVDRLLFLEIIKALDLYRPLTSHTYVGLAGPFLEDFRLVAQSFPKIKLVSVEKDRETYKRQKFHLCSKRVDLHRSTFKEFLSTEFPTGLTIAWLDYTDLTRDGLLEISDVARRSPPHSMLRVTVRAESPVYHALGLRPRQVTLPAQKAAEFGSFADDFRARYVVDEVAYDDAWFGWDSFCDAGFPALLMNMLRSVIEAACTHPKQFLPLHAVKYSDGTIMLSFTGVFCSADERAAMTKHFRDEGILHAGPLAVERIDIPILTTKERLHLEGCLPADAPTGQTSLKRLGYLVEGDDSEENSTEKMQQYEKYHRFYPYFAKFSP